MSAQVAGKPNADVLLSFLGHCQDDMHNTHNRFWLIAGDWAIRVGGSNSHIHMEVQGHKCTTPSLKRLHIKKIYSQILFDQAT